MRPSCIRAFAAVAFALCCLSCNAQTPRNAPKPSRELSAAGLRTFRKGQADARRDIARGRLVIQASVAFGSPSAAFGKLLRERYKIEMKIISTDEMTDEELGYKEGYNGISLPEIERRYGKGVLDRAYTESEKNRNGQ